MTTTTTTYAEMDAVYNGNPLRVTLTVHPPSDLDAHAPFTFQSEMYVTSEEPLAVALDLNTWGLPHVGVAEGIAVLADVLRKLNVDIRPVEA